MPAPRARVRVRGRSHPGLVLLVAVLGLLNAAPAHAAVVGEWHFDGNLRDTSSVGNDASFGAAPNDGTFGSGRFSQAITVHPSPGSWVTTNANGTNYDTFTVEGWARTNDISANPTEGITSLQTATNNRNFLLSFWQACGCPGPAVTFSASLGGTARAVNYPAASTVDGRWHHYAGTAYYDGANTTLTLYVDGVSRASGTWAGAPDNPAAKQDFGYQLDGQVDEVRLFDTALSPAEVRAEYRATSVEVSGSSISSGGCLSGTTTTSFASLIGPVVTPTDCSIRFGSGDASSMLRMYQADGAGSAMYATTTGVLDGSFGTAGVATSGGPNDYVYDVALDSQGRIVTAGEQCGTCDGRISRFTTAGVPDVSFNGTGTRSIIPGGNDSVITAVATQPDGKVVGVGYDDGGGATSRRSLLVRLTSGGALDPTCASAGYQVFDWAAGAKGDTLNDVVVQPDGKILATGYTQSPGAVPNLVVARFTADCRLDTTFDQDGLAIYDVVAAQDDYGQSLVVQPDGKIVVSGIAHAAGDATLFVARLNVDGTLDNGFGTSGVVQLTSSSNWPASGTWEYRSAIALQQDGRIVVAGNEINADLDFYLARLTTSGALDPTFNGGGVVTTDVSGGADDGIQGISIQPDGKILVSGESDDGATQPVTLARYRTDGALDTSFDGDGIDLVAAANTPTSEDVTTLATGTDGMVMVAATGIGAKTELVKLAATPVPDFATGANDWDSGTTGMFGACLRSLGASASAGWSVDAGSDCQMTDADAWNAIPSGSGASATVARTTAGVGAADARATLRFGVKPGAQTPGTYVAPIVVESLAPDLSPPSGGTPTISGSAAFNQWLTAAPGAWSGSAIINYTYQWRLCDNAGANCSDIAGATGDQYRVRNADVGGTIRVQVTATNSEGSATGTSTQTALVGAGATTSETFITGFEHGTTVTCPGSWPVPCADNGLVSNAGATSVVSTDRVRNGNYSFRATSSTNTQMAYWDYQVPPTHSVERYSVNIANIGTDTSGQSMQAILGEQFIPSGPGYWFQVSMSPTQQLRAQFLNQGTGTIIASIQGPVVPLDQWITIDTHLDVSGTTWKADWQVDGAPQAQLQKAGMAVATVQTIGIGGGIGTFDRFYDDVAGSNSAADYPLSNAKILGYAPNQAAPHNTPADFSYSLNSGGTWPGNIGTIDVSSPTTPGTAAYLQDWPNTGTQLVRQTAQTGADYARYELQDSTEGASATVTAVRIIGAHRDPAADAPGNNVNVTPALGATVGAAAYSVDPKGGGWFHYGGMAARPGGGSWTAADITNLNLHLDSSNVGTVPWTDALMVEAEYPTAPLATNILPPAINGATRQGSTLSAVPGVWNDPLATLTYSWWSCTTGTPQLCTFRATGASYVVAAGDVGTQIKLLERATTGSGTQTAAAPQSALVSAAAPTIAAMTGFESGVMPSYNPGNNASLMCVYETGQHPTITSTSPRSGRYAMHADAQAGNAVMADWCPAAAQTVTRVWVRFDHLPTDTAQLGYMDFYGSNAGATHCTMYVSAGGQLRSQATNVTVVGPTVREGTWHEIDARCNMSGANNVLTWAVDGVPQPTATATSNPGATTTGDLDLGTVAGSSVAQFTFDDWAYSTTAADYPLGNGKIIGYEPNAAAPHNTPANFSYSINSGGAWPGNIGTIDTTNPTVPGTAAYLDDWPNTGTELVRQTAFSGADYARYEFEDSLEASTAAVNAVRISGAHRDPAANTPGNNVNVTPALGATVGAATYSVDPGGGQMFYYAGQAARPGGGSWTAADVTNLNVHLDSTNIAPTPWTDALLAEVDYPLSASPPVNSARPSVSVPDDWPRVGNLLRASNGSWSGCPCTYSYEWQSYDSASSHWAPIAGAGTGSTYRLTAAELGRRIRVMVTATGPGGAQSEVTQQTGAVASKRPSSVVLTGFENAAFSTAGLGLYENVFSGTGGTYSADTSVVRSGTYSLKVTKTGAAGSTGSVIFPSVAGVPSVAMRFSVYFATLPSSGYTQFWEVGGVSAPWVDDLQVDQNGQLSAKTGTGGTWVNGPVVTTGRWYVIDVLADASTANANSLQWRVDGVPQPTVWDTASAAGTYARPLVGLWSFGTSGATTAYFDDIDYSTTKTDYPIADGKVLPYRVNGAGTTLGASNFTNDDASAIDSSSPGRVDDLPLTSLTDYVAQATASTASYLEFGFDDTVQDSNPIAVRGEATYHAAAGAATGEIRFRDQFGGENCPLGTCGTAQSMNVGGTLTYKSKVLAAPLYGWNPFEIPALNARVGYSSSAPDPYFDALMVEADYAMASNEPVPTARPTISGTTMNGQTLTATTGSWLSNTPYSSTYEWRSCDWFGENCSAVLATTPTYTLTAAEDGARMRVTVIATNEAGTTAATSLPSSVVTDTVPVSFLTGTAQGNAGSSSTAISLPRPAGTYTGMLLVAAIETENAVTVVTPPAGWTLILHTGNGSGTNTFYKIATGNEPDTYTFTIGSSIYLAGAIMGVMNANGVTPIDSGAGAPTGVNGFTATGLTTSVANELLIGCWGNDQGKNLAPPGSMIERFDVQSGGLPAVMCATEPRPATGATGTRAATGQGGANGQSQLIAIKP